VGDGDLGHNPVGGDDIENVQSFNGRADLCGPGAFVLLVLAAAGDVRALACVADDVLPFASGPLLFNKAAYDGQGNGGVGRHKSLKGTGDVSANCIGVSMVIEGPYWCFCHCLSIL
jgi:hypothetical protein